MCIFFKFWRWFYSFSVKAALHIVPTVWAPKVVHERVSMGFLTAHCCCWEVPIWKYKCFLWIHVIVLNTGKLFGHTTLSSILTAAVGKQIAESIMLDNSHILIISLIFEIIYKVYNNYIYNYIISAFPLFPPILPKLSSWFFFKFIASFVNIQASPTFSGPHPASH